MNSQFRVINDTYQDLAQLIVGNVVELSPVELRDDELANEGSIRIFRWIQSRVTVNSLHDPC
jgi:hypothetical protein